MGDDDGCPVVIYYNKEDAIEDVTLNGGDTAHNFSLRRGNLLNPVCIFAGVIVGYSQISEGEEAVFKRNKPVVLVWGEDDDGEFLSRVSTQQGDQQWEEADAPAPTKKDAPKQAPPKRKAGVKVSAAEVQSREVIPAPTHGLPPYCLHCGFNPNSVPLRLRRPISSPKRTGCSLRPTGSISTR